MWRVGTEIAFFQGPDVEGRFLSKSVHNTSWYQFGWPRGKWGVEDDFHLEFFCYYFFSCGF